MKHTVFTILFLLTSLGGMIAQTSPSYGFAFRYQGVAYENGQAIAQGMVALTFVIHEDQANGPMVYSETRTDVPVNGGQFAVTIGGPGANSTTGSLRELDWGGRPYFLETRLSLTNDPMTVVSIGSSEILGAPWLNPVHVIRLSSAPSAAPYGDLYLRAGDGVAANYHALYIDDGPDSDMTRRNFWFMGTDSRHMDVSVDGYLSVGQLTIAENMTHNLEVVGSACKSAGGSSWAVCSDPRIKKNMRPLDLGLETLKKIQPIWFQYDSEKASDFDERIRLGLNADEVAHIPELKEVMIEVHDKYGIPDLKMVQSSDALMYISVNAIKEQQKQIDQLTEIVAQYKEILKDQARRIEHLEAGILQEGTHPVAVETASK